MKKIILTIFSAMIFFTISGNVLAAVQIDSTLRPSNLPDYSPAEATSTENSETAATQTAILYLGNLLSKVLLFVGAMAVIYLIIAGAKYIFAFGNDDLLGQAKRGITWTIWGLILIMLSYAIVRGVIKILISTDVS